MERARLWLEELKRRRIFRAVAIFAVAVFAILQLAETLVAGLHLPGWTVTVLVVAAAAAFPVVLAVAWLFDVTSAGLVRTPPRSSASGTDASTVPVANPAVKAGAITALLEQLARAPERAASDRAPLRAGDTVGRFELLRELGRGGFGIVFEARDRELRRLVAIKTVRPRRGIDPAALRAEAEAAAQLQHPNIVTVHDVASSGDEAWIVLELLRGETLEQRLRRGHVPLEEALRIATGVARGLAHAHTAGVVHRDLKPANVFLCDDGGVKILDFGVSRVFGSASGAEGGTPAYMAPEQRRREPQDARADVFAAAVILYEMLTGSRPYAVDSEASSSSAALDARPAPPPPMLAPRVPRTLRRLVTSALEASPSRRPRDGKAWLDALLDVQAQRARRRARRAGAIVGAAGIAAGAAAFGLVALRSTAPRDLEPGARIPVAVADIHNSTGDPELDGLSGMLVTSLEQSRHLLVLTRSRLIDALRQLGKDPPAVLDESLALEIGRSLGVRALLLATVHRFDDRYAIELRALDPVRNDYLFTVKEEGRGKASVPDVIDRLARSTRERLRDGSKDGADAGRRVAEITTGNLAAYDHYFRARQAIDMRQFARANDELQAALRIDPDFALAHLGVVVLDSWTQKFSASAAAVDVRSHLETALRLVARLPEKERLALLAWKAHLDADAPRATELRDQAARAYPQDKEAVFWAGDERFHQGDAAAALPYFERALALDPDYRIPMEHLVRGLAAMGRAADALTWSQRWADAAKDDESRRALGAALLVAGRLDDAQRIFASTGAPDAPAIVSWLAYHGRVREAELRARRAIESLPPIASRSHEPRSNPAAPEEALANVLALQGRWAEARRMREHVGAASPVELAWQRLGFAVGTRLPADARRAAASLRAAQLDDGIALVQAALAAALADDDSAPELARAARASRYWAVTPPPMRVLLQAALAWNEGRRDDAEAAVRAASEKVSLTEERYQALVVLGEWAACRGRAAEAVELLDQAERLPWPPEGGGADGAWFWLRPRALFFLADAHAQLGNAARARETLLSLRTLWERADGDVPLLPRITELQARLDGAAVSGGGDDRPRREQ